MSHDLRFTRVIAAPPEEVFAAFTEPGGQEAFYGQDDPGWIVRSECDLRVGGIWTVEFGPSSSQLYRHRHVFRVLDPPRRLVLTTTETRLDGSSFDTQVEFVFEEADGKTLMTCSSGDSRVSSCARSICAGCPTPSPASSARC